MLGWSETKKWNRTSEMTYPGGMPTRAPRKRERIGIGLILAAGLTSTQVGCHPPDDVVEIRIEDVVQETTMGDGFKSFGEIKGHDSCGLGVAVIEASGDGIGDGEECSGGGS